MYNPGIGERSGGKSKERRRTRNDITYSILKNAIGGRGKTHIMYKANLSNAQTNEYLSLLLEKDFLETFTKKSSKIIRFYKTKDKGLKFIKIYEDALPLLALLE